MAEAAEKKRRIPLWAELLLLAALIAGAVATLHAGYRHYMRSAYPMAYTELVDQWSAEYDLDPSLVYAVIRTESGFDPNAVSHAGAVGLMQMMEDSFEWVQWRDKTEDPLPTERLFDPEISIRYGCLMLHLLIEMYSNEQTALAAYNGGTGNVSKWLKDPACSDDGKTLREIPYKETRNYVRKVLEAQKMYRELYDLA